MKYTSYSSTINLFDNLAKLSEQTYDQEFSRCDQIRWVESQSGTDGNASNNNSPTANKFSKISNQNKIK